MTRRILISAPRERVSEYLRDFSRIADYEKKVQTCAVSHPDEQTALAEVSGRTFGLPWKGALRLVHTGDGGYRSEMVRGPLRTALGGYHLRPVSGGTLLTHEEKYHIPFAFRPLRPFLSRWLSRTMEREIDAIKEGAERLHRKRLIEDIDRDVQLEA